MNPNGKCWLYPFSYRDYRALIEAVTAILIASHFVVVIHVDLARCSLMANYAGR